MAAFQAQWVTTGFAKATRAGPRLILMGTATPTQRPPATGSVHLRIVGELVPATARSPPSAGFAITAHDIAADGSETLRLRAQGAVATEATHGARAPPHAPRLHSVQATVQTGLGRALSYAHQLAAKQRRTVVISLHNATAVRDVTRRVPDGKQPAAAPDAAPADGEQQSAKRQRRDGAEAAAAYWAREKRRRDGDAPASRRPTGRASLQNLRNIESLNLINRRFPGSVRVRLDDGTPSLDMIAAARRAARSTSTDTLVFSARTPTGRAVPLWDELRTWDPGD